MNVMQSLRDYTRSVLDTNKDGQITFKDFIELFPNSAIAIAVVFVDLVVLVAEYRVWDVGYQMTGDTFKAIGFVLVSAVPFYLGQVFWLYPVANWVQKWIAAGMVVSSLYTSWIFGTADLSKTYDIASIVATVTNMTAGYIVVVLAYILFDDGIKAYRIKKQVEGAARQEREYQILTRQTLRELAKTKALHQEIVDEFGDADLVDEQANRVRGKKHQNQQPQQFRPAMTAHAQDVYGEQLARDKANGNRPDPTPAERKHE
jgi:hypothetical protein